MYFVVSRNQRERLTRDAERARTNDMARVAAIGLVILYNLIGVLDIVSTNTAISLERGEEANPLIRTMMVQFGMGWILGKLAMQALVSAMVIWFPHPMVLAMFTLAIFGNAVAVANNFMIVAGF